MLGRWYALLFFVFLCSLSLGRTTQRESANGRFGRRVKESQMLRFYAGDHALARRRTLAAFRPRDEGVIAGSQVNQRFRTERFDGLNRRGDGNGVHASGY
jgi:hypothetical protein